MVGVVVLVLLAAGAGAVVGRTTAPGPDIVVAPGPVVEESPEAERLPLGNAPSSEPTPEATPTATPAPQQVIVTPVQPTDWPAILSAAPGLDDTETTASGYRLVNGGISGAQVAGVLGSVFGAFGTPVSDGDSWVVGSEGGPTVTVDNDPLVSWRFEDPSRVTPPATGPPMTPERALGLATLLLGSIGVDTASVDWQVDRFADAMQVTAWQLVAGARTQLAWRVGFDAAGSVAEASGFSAGFEEVPEYQVVGAATAVERSGQPRWTAIPPRLITGPPEDAGPNPSATASPTAAPPLPGLSVPVHDVTVTGAELGLAQYWQPDGGLLILPAYRLAGEDGSSWSLLAVGDQYVAFVNQPYPAADSTTR